MTTTTTPPVDVATILASVIRSSHPKLALPTIAANHDLSLRDLQHLLHQHGYPDKTRMREAWRKAVAGHDHELDAGVPAPTPAPAASGQERRDPYVTALPVASLFADPLYQRDLDERRVQKMASSYDQALVGILEVSRRSEDEYAVLDGQHRWAAYRDYCFAREDSPHIACRVHTGLSLAEEADLYHRLNTTRKQLTGWDRWVARRAAGEQAVADIEATATAHGFTIGMTTAPGVLRATKSAENVVALGGLGLLHEVLGIIRAAYGDDQDGLDAGIIFGLGHVLHAYPRDDLDRGRLVAALSGIMPRQLKARASAVRELHKGTLDRLTAHVIVERYNAEKGPKTTAFFERVKPATKAKPTRSSRRSAAIRSWAERHGTPVTSKRIPRAIREAFEAAHPDEGSAA